MVIEEDIAGEPQADRGNGRDSIRIIAMRRMPLFLRVVQSRESDELRSSDRF
jgi:hypothetical protein